MSVIVIVSISAKKLQNRVCIRYFLHQQEREKGRERGGEREREGERGERETHIISIMCT